MAILISRKYPLQYAGRKLNFPVIGDATFNEDGSLEVADEKVKEFIAATEPSFDFKVKGKVTKKDKEDEKVEETRKMLATLELPQLVELAKESGIVPAKMQNWSDDKIRKEILKKMSEPE